MAGINIPIFAGNRVHSDVLEADAQLKQARSQLGDLRGRIDYEVRTALLDLNAAAEQVEVARSSVDLAEQALRNRRIALPPEWPTTWKSCRRRNP